MQRQALFPALTVAVAAPAWADTAVGTGTSTTARHHRDAMVEKLQLNPDQAQKFKDIMQQQQSKMDALRAETHQRLATVLTPDQLTRYDEMARNRPHHQHGRGKPGATPPATQTTPASNTPPTASAPQTPPGKPVPPAAPAQN